MVNLHIMTQRLGDSDDVGCTAGTLDDLIATTGAGCLDGLLGFVIVMFMGLRGFGRLRGRGSGFGSRLRGGLRGRICGGIRDGLRGSLGGGGAVISVGHTDQRAQHGSDSAVNNGTHSNSKYKNYAHYCKDNSFGRHDATPFRSVHYNAFVSQLQVPDAKSTAYFTTNPGMICTLHRNYAMV